MTAKFVWEDGDMVLSQCVHCRHKKKDNICTAFSEGIPDKIMSNRHDHRKPFKGDNGIRFEPITKKQGTPKAWRKRGF